MSTRQIKIHSGNRAGIPRARARFLTQAIALEESDAPGVVGMGVFFTALFLAGSVAWASVTSLSEISRSPGEVVPSGLIHKIQHLEGGLVSDIHVRNGSRVEAGDTLVSLAPSATRSELEQLTARRADIRLNLARNEALLAGGEPEFGDLVAHYPALGARQRALINDQRESRRTQLALIDAQMAQREGELESAQAQIQTAREEIDLLQQLRAMRSSLADQQIVARAEVINVSVRLTEAMRDLRELQGAERVSHGAVEETQRRRAELLGRLRESDSVEASKLTSELAEIEQALVRVRDRMSRLAVRAPVAGIVKGLTLNTIGSVIEPGQVIMEIVPVGDALIVESRVSTTDVGHIHPGQTVDVKVLSYETTRFGTLAGTLQRVSASTYLDESNSPYYRAEISLARNYLGDDPNRHPILPGMTVEADIVTGNKTILDYLLKPVYRGFRTAMSER